MLIVDVARAGLKPCWSTTDVGVPLTNDPSRVAIKDCIDVRELKSPAMLVL